MTTLPWLLRSALTELGPCRFAVLLAACPVIVAVAWGMVAVALEAAPDRALPCPHAPPDSLEIVP